MMESKELNEPDRCPLCGKYLTPGLEEGYVCSSSKCPIEDLR
jgi:hypothetical protein